jgi:hypothetical protein
MTSLEIAPLVTNVLLGIAVVVTGIVAVIGLRSWRRELEGKAKFEVARDLIRATYRLREAIQRCRLPTVGASELPKGYEGDLVIDKTKEEDSQAWGHVLSNRWISVQKAMQELESHALEAEALWGQPVRATTDQMLHCTMELFIAIWAFTSNVAGIKHKASSGEQMQLYKSPEETRRAVFGYLDNPFGSPDDDNPLSKKIARAIRAIEDQVLPHLRRS